ncbi:hypothetical protein HOY80DRAFT_1094242 [Tuber brumale]|nr:hypothetical protein HOY80DRAFT_1094242 [Tuber brumale]
MLYIVGGFMKYASVNTDQDGPNPVLRSLNLSKGFTTSVGSFNYIRTEKVPDTIPGVADAAFFPTESGFDLTFGKFYPYNVTIYGKKGAPIQNNKWQYEIAAQRWTNTGITLKNWFRPNSSRRVSSSMTAWIPSLKKGFLFGGVFLSVNETSLEVKYLEEHTGLIVYDQATNTWTNESTTFGGISNGGLVHITTAVDEVLIQFGGRVERFTRLIQFSDIRIYSTRQSKWYTQRLRSDAPVPAPRFAFCTALKSAPDGSSHQIYILGGLEGSTQPNSKGGPAATSVWVLSIPSFEWAQLPVMPKTLAADPRVRISPKCLAIGEHYIFYYGGRNSFDDTTAAICDKQADAAFLLDVNTLRWTDEFTPNEGKYEIPPQVIGLIGGDKSGGSTKKGPPNGWSDPGLETVMALKTLSTGRSGPDSISESSKTNVGAIVGGIVGGIVLLALLGAMMHCRRHQKEVVPGAQDPTNGSGVRVVPLPSQRVVKIDTRCEKGPSEVEARDAPNSARPSTLRKPAELSPEKAASEMDTKEEAQSAPNTLAQPVGDVQANGSGAVTAELPPEGVVRGEAQSAPNTLAQPVGDVQANGSGAVTVEPPPEGVSKMDTRYGSGDAKIQK